MALRESFKFTDNSIRITFPITTHDSDHVNIPIYGIQRVERRKQKSAFMSYQPIF